MKAKEIIIGVFLYLPLKAKKTIPDFKNKKVYVDIYSLSMT